MISTHRRTSTSDRPTRTAAVLVRSGLRGCALLLIAWVLCCAVGVDATSNKKNAAYLSSTVGGSGGVYTLYTITGCSECTINLSQRWCPSTMRCYPANNCTCDGPVPCIDLRTCFYGSRPRCRECLDSGGVFCAGGSSVLTPRHSASVQEVRCYPPSAALLPARDGTGAATGPQSLTVHGAPAVSPLLTCSASACQGGQCIKRAADCPVEAADPLMRSYEVISVMVVIALSCLVLRNIYKLVA